MVDDAELNKTHTHSKHSKHVDKDSKEPKKQKPKTFLKCLWHFIWEEDSIASWVVNVVLAFLIIKFLVYPVLGFAFGTSYPIVAVVSGSMEHDAGFDAWWLTANCCQAGDCNSQEYLYAAYDITKDKFRSFRFKNGFNKGDMMVLFSPDDAKVGDSVVFIADSFPEPIIHRVVKIEGDSYFTKGDHNCGTSHFEREIPKERLIGKAVLRIPYLGWIKLAFVEFVQLFIGR